MEVLRYKSSDGLVEIKVATSSIKNSWERFRSRINEGASTYCDYRTSLLGRLWLTDIERMGEMPELVSDTDATEWLALPPVMYETNVYTFTIRFSGIQGKPTIVHPNREVVEQFNWFEAGKDAALLTGSVDFINEPGIFPLRFRYKPIGKPERTDVFEFRVVSPKLDTKEDYRHILEAINREYNNLVFKYLTKTFQNFQRKGKENNNLIWLSIFRSVVDDYIKAMEFIVNKPHIREQKQERFSRADRIRRWTPAMAEQYFKAEAEQTLETRLFRHEEAISTQNTRENRFVKYTIESIGKRLDSVLSELQRNYAEELSEDEKQQLKGYQISLSKLARSRFFRSIGRFEGFKQESIVLQKRTGYAQIYRTWFILNSGLSLYQGTTQIGTRPIWELYELWCFLKMKQLITDILGLTPDSEFIHEEKSAMLDPFKESEVEHTIVFQKGDDADYIELKYQHTYNRHKSDDGVHTATTEQRPDIVLNITKPDGFTLTYLYDAKYRVLDDKNANDMTEGEPKGDFADYPPSDAINQMHRYRDAIYYGSDRQTHSAKEIIGGYILFPGRVTDAKVRERYYFKSIETVNIGAFPLLPSKDGDDDLLLKEHLTDLLLNKTKHEQIKDSIPQRGLKYVSAELANPEDMVLVGFIKDAATEQAIRENSLYYVRIGETKGSIKLVSGFETTKYLLLHDTKNNRHIYRLTGQPPIMISAAELKAKGFNPTGNFYMAFNIKSLDDVEYPGLNISDILFHGGKLRTAPYFTTISELKTK